MLDLSKSPDSLSPIERTTIINELRSRMQSKIEISTEEYAYGIRCLRTQRAAMTRPGVSKAKEKASLADIDLKDL